MPTSSPYDRNGTSNSTKIILLEDQFNSDENSGSMKIRLKNFIGTERVECRQKSSSLEIFNFTEASVNLVSINSGRLKISHCVPVYL